MVVPAIRIHGLSSDTASFDALDRSRSRGAQGEVLVGPCPERRRKDHRHDTTAARISDLPSQCGRGRDIRPGLVGSYPDASSSSRLRAGRGRLVALADRGRRCSISWAGCRSARSRLPWSQLIHRSTSIPLRKSEPTRRQSLKAHPYCGVDDPPRPPHSRPARPVVSIRLWNRPFAIVSMRRATEWQTVVPVFAHPERGRGHCAPGRHFCEQGPVKSEHLV